MMGEKSKVKVLYVLGAGRSGSTLLANILGQIMGMQNVGELYYLWENGIHQGGVCGCGEPVLKCSFWSEILSASLGASIEYKAKQMQELGRQIARTRHIPMLALSSSRHRMLSKSSDYTTNLSKVYDAIQTNTNCRVIIDASKFPSYAQILRTISSVDLHILHLVRDPRAVAFSWQRRKHDPATDDTFGRMSYTKSSLIWLMWNLGGELLRQKHGQYLQIRYEDLIGQPILTTKQILDFVGIYTAQLPFLDDKEVYLTANHSIAGNPVRFNHGAVTLKMDREWEAKMTSIEKSLVTSITWPLLRRYTYSLGAPHPV